MVHPNSQSAEREPLTISRLRRNGLRRQRMSFDIPNDDMALSLYQSLKSSGYYRFTYLNLSSRRLDRATSGFHDNPIHVGTLILRDTGICSGTLPMLFNLLLNFKSIARINLDCNNVDAETLLDIIHFLFVQRLSAPKLRVSARWTAIHPQDIHRVNSVIRTLPVKLDLELSRLISYRPSREIDEVYPVEKLGETTASVLERLSTVEEAILTAGCRALEIVMKTSIDYRALKLSPYGSVVSGFYLPESSDIDLVIHFNMDLLPNSMCGLTAKQEHAISEKFSRELGRLLRQVWRCKTEVIGWGKVPLVKTFNVPGGFRELNIILGNTLGIYNSWLLKWYARDDCMIYWVGMQVKIWAKRQGLVSKPENNFSYMSAYAWMLLVIFFFQVCVRSIHSIQLASFRKRVAVWGIDIVAEIANTDAVIEDADCDAATALDPKKTLVSFFKFYAYQFDWEKMTVDIKSPEDGLNRRCFDTGQNGDQFAAIRDPYERDRNLARGMSRPAFENMMQCLIARAVY